MAVPFERQMILFSRRHGLTLHWQALKFEYRRAVLPCGSGEELAAIVQAARRMKHVRVNSWACYEGEFEGYAYVMRSQDYDGMQEQQNAESARLKDWWQRYHDADEETRRLMACGDIP